ncbi:hypothetical protein BGZ97_004993, partial [Linnemannia gamsii]
MSLRIIPSRIMHCPGAVLEVGLPTNVDLGRANHSTTLVCMGLGDATNDASSADEAVDALQIIASPAVETISRAKPSLQQIVKLASKKAQVFEIEQQLISSLDPAIQKMVQASLRAQNMSFQARNDGRMEDYERHRNEYDRHFQEMKEIMAQSTEAAGRTATLMLEFMVKKADEADHRATELNATIEQLTIQNAKSTQELNATIEQLKIQNVKSMQELNATIEQLKIQNAKSTQELIAKQDEASVNMKKMREELMGQFAVLQSRIQAVLTQTYQLHEYPIPRLFVVLPQDPSRWHATNPLSNKFRLHFLCECGEHTKSINSQTKVPHQIHLAKHGGYDIAQPSEFFKQYGSYVLTLLKILEFGIIMAGVAVPALPLLISTESIEQTTTALKQLQEYLEFGLERVIRHTDNLSAHDDGVDEGAVEQVNRTEALEGADLRKLDTFLKGSDGSKALGNLYRTVTDKGHVKWVCIDHYRENYKKTATDAFRRAVELVAGVFDENSGIVEVDLTSRVMAEQFYEALEKATSVYELKIKLSWDTTYGDFKRLRDSLRKTNVGILEFDYTGTGPASDIGNRYRRYDPIVQIMGNPSIQSFTMASVRGDFLHRSNLVPADTNFSNLKHLLIGGFDSDAFIDKFYMVHAPTLTTLVLPSNSIRGNGAQALAEALKTNKTLTTLALDNNQIGDNGAKALAEALRTNKTLITLTLIINKIGDNGAQALAEALKTNKTLATLDLGNNWWLKDNGVQAIKALKTGQTLAPLNLASKSIREIRELRDSGVLLLEALKNGDTVISASKSIRAYRKLRDDGAKALAEALTTNSTVATLDLENNKIGDDGAKALAEALKTNSMVTIE